MIILKILFFHLMLNLAKNQAILIDVKSEKRNVILSNTIFKNLTTEIASNFPKIPVWEPCGGEGHFGGTECDESSICIEKNDGFSRCEPKANDPSRINEWEQCGGITYNGNILCQEWLTCVKIHNWYSQCEFIDRNNIKPESDKIPVWESCGGVGHSGETECDDSSNCIEKNEWYFRCEPKQNDPNRVNEWDQCNGINYLGNSICQAWLTCVKKNNWFWQCEKYLIRTISKIPVNSTMFTTMKTSSDFTLPTTTVNSTWISPNASSHYPHETTLNSTINSTFPSTIGFTNGTTTETTENTFSVTTVSSTPLTTSDLPVTSTIFTTMHTSIESTVDSSFPSSFDSSSLTTMETSFFYFTSNSIITSSLVTNSPFEDFSVKVLQHFQWLIDASNSV